MTFERNTLPCGSAPHGAATAQNRAQEGGQRRRGTPNEKVIAAANRVAERLGINIPEGVSKSFDACRGFLDANPLPPSERQLAFARALSEEHGEKIPKECLGDPRKLRGWIGKVLAKHKGLVPPALTPRHA